MITFLGNKREKIAANMIRELYKNFPKHPIVINDYAAMLMLDYKNHMDNFEKQDENVAEINSLRLGNPSSEYLHLIYGKSLYNQIVSYVHLKAGRKNSEIRHACDERIGYFYSELVELYKHNPDNKIIQRSLEMANTMLHYPGA